MDSLSLVAFPFSYQKMKIERYLVQNCLFEYNDIIGYFVEYACTLAVQQEADDI